MLLFTDMVMPGGISGYDLARQLRVERPALPVIFSAGTAGNCSPAAFNSRKA